MDELDEPLAFLQLLWSISHGLQSRSKRMEARIGVTGPQRLVIRIVAACPAIASSELAAVLQFHPSTLTGILRRLEERGYIVRSPDPADGRRVLISLSAKGRTLNRTHDGTPEHVVRRLITKHGKRDVAIARRILVDLAAMVNTTD